MEKIKLIDLEMAEYNPRRISDNNIQKLRTSIHSFGFVDPIIINLNNNRIIGGHQRYKVLMEDYDDNKELNLFRLGDVGWAFPDEELSIESEEQEKALNISLNQNNLMGEWDNEKLKDIFKDLNEVDFDLELTGFDDFEIDLFLDDDYEVFNYQHLLDEEENKEKDVNDSIDIHQDTTNTQTITQDQGEQTNTSPNNNITDNPIDSDDLQSRILKAIQEDKTDNEIDYADVVPDDYVDVKGDNANKSYVLSIGFNTHETANKFLDYLGYHRHMKRDTLQFMWTELDWDLDKLLYEKDQRRISQEEQETCLEEEQGHIWEFISK